MKKFNLWPVGSELAKNIIEAEGSMLRLNTLFIFVNPQSIDTSCQAYSHFVIIWLIYSEINESTRFIILVFWVTI